eukprot:TRINITY_DN4927_c0_g1_i2.p1 TRINITY_DN4927_c0_g1~~TRINITY_DN4927_c0_g1_i2.p1  ORF type:complete len:224 (-),score=45.43 TRINITY_DN4927_c0_g1_i2:782-1453(-)
MRESAWARMFQPSSSLYHRSARIQTTGMVIQLANRSYAYPAGLVEDVLVWVNKLIFPADFHILEMEGESSSDKTPLILGRPFLKTAQTKIDVHAGILSMEFGDSIVRFNILDAMKHPMEEHSVFHIDLIDDLVNNSYADLCEEFPEIADFGDSMCGDLCASCDGDKSCSVCSEISAFLGYDESVPVLADCTTGDIYADVQTAEAEHQQPIRLLPFVVQPPNWS